MEYIAYLHEDSKSDFGVSFPDVPGCVTAGKTLGEALRMAAETLILHIEGMVEEAQGTENFDALDYERLDAAFLGRARDIGFFEILAFEEQRLSCALRKRIGEAVTEVQSGGVTALAEIEEGLARHVRLLDRYRFDDDAGSAEKYIALTAGVRSNLGFDDDGEFQEICGADQAAISGVDELGEQSGFGLPEKDGGERGGIQNHLGRPRSS
jgi:predicted RNase H-like HicB family nuclease